MLSSTTPIKCPQEVTTGHFVNLPITYKSKKSNFKFCKMTETKKLHLNMFKCSKILLFYKIKMLFRPQKMQITVEMFAFWCYQILFLYALFLLLLFMHRIRIVRRIWLFLLLIYLMPPFIKITCLQYFILSGLD